MTGLWLRIPNAKCPRCPSSEDGSKPVLFANVASVLNHIRVKHGLTGRAYGLVVDEIRLANYSRIDEAPR